MYFVQSMRDGLTRREGGQRMNVRVRGRASVKQGGTAGYDPVPAEMQGQVFFVTIVIARAEPAMISTDYRSSLRGLSPRQSQPIVNNKPI